MRKGGIYRKTIIGILATLVLMVWVNPIKVFGAEDPAVGTTNDDIENMIEVGKSLIGKTPYVYGGGHHDWEGQKELDVPTGLDNSSYVSWVLYRGMGIDMGYAPTSSNFDIYFDTVNVGTLEGVERGDLIADDRSIEIYLGQGEDGKHYSLIATNNRSEVSIQETNWGLGVTTKSIIRPSIEYAKEGSNGLSYNESAVIDALGEREIGGDDQITMDEGTSSGLVEPETDKEDTEELDKVKDENKTSSKNTVNGDSEDLYKWLDPIVDFSGASNTHSKSDARSSQIDGNSKGLKGNQKGIFNALFGGF